MDDVNFSQVNTYLLALFVVGLLTERNVEDSQNMRRDEARRIISSPAVWRPFLYTELLVVTHE